MMYYISRPIKFLFYSFILSGIEYHLIEHDKLKFIVKIKKNN